MTTSVSNERKNAEEVKNIKHIGSDDDWDDMLPPSCSETASMNVHGA